MTAQAAGRDELREVRILGFPLDVYQRTAEAFEGLRREFALVALRTPEALEVPARLLQLIEALTDEFEGASSEPDRLRDEAISRGEHVVDELVHHLPPAAEAACVALNGMLDEADEFCRQGEILLSLASPPEAVVFRRWYLGEMTAQLHGEPPIPWSEVDQEAVLADPRLRGTTAG